MPKKSNLETQKTLIHLYSVNPDIVILSVMDVLIRKVCDQIAPPGTDRVTFLFKFYTIYLNTIYFTEQDLLLEPTSTFVNNFSKFTAEDRNKTSEMLQKLIENMSVEGTAKHLGQLIRSWLLNASRDYLLSGEVCGEFDIDSDSRVTIIRKYETTITRLFELNF